MISLQSISIQDVRKHFETHVFVGSWNCTYCVSPRKKQNLSIAMPSHFAPVCLSQKFSLHVIDRQKLPFQAHFSGRSPASLSSKRVSCKAVAVLPEYDLEAWQYEKLQNAIKTGRKKISVSVPEGTFKFRTNSSSVLHVRISALRIEGPLFTVCRFNN